MGVSAPMKFGMRTPSPRRSLKARTTGKWKRQARPSSPGMGARARGGYGTPGKPSTTRSTGRPRSAFGIYSSKADSRPRFGGAFLLRGLLSHRCHTKLCFRRITRVMKNPTAVAAIGLPCGAPDRIRTCNLLIRSQLL